MYKKGGIPILTIIVLLAIIAGLYFWLRPSCPDTCDDNNYCTADSCSKETNHLCVHTPLNGPQEGCKAEVNCGTKTCKDGVCDANYKDDCCGNKKCETGETYDNCAEDCPDCDDENECTKDSYDYHLQKCINEVIKPCCGNGICDKGAEANSNCEKDCPSCDDKSKLTIDRFNYETQKCENVPTHYFMDDFEEGVGSWTFSIADGQPTSTGWELTTEEGNNVLRGRGHNWANLNAGPWENFALELRFKIVTGNMYFNYRINEGEAFKRYMVLVDPTRISIGKSTSGDNHLNDLSFKEGVSLGGGWHKLDIKGYGNVLNVYVDNELMLKYKDDSSPILSGKVTFETFDGSEFLIDNVEIKIVKEGDVSA